MREEKIREMEKFATQIRIETAKQMIEAGAGHIGGTFSLAELIAVLYDEVLFYDPKDPKMEERDRLIVSKGHAGPAIYAALALKGFFPMDVLKTLNRGGTMLPSHCDSSKTPGVDFTTGSLGQGLSAAIGVAYGLRLNGKNNYIYAVLGDGECQEGQVWEAMLAAPKYRLDHLICFVDNNKYQIDGSIEEMMPLGDIAGKFRSLGWNAQNVDGHDVKAICRAVYEAKANRGAPSCIVLNTVKGQGCDELVAMRHGCHHIHLDEALGKTILAQLEEKMAAFAPEE